MAACRVLSLAATPHTHRRLYYSDNWLGGRAGESDLEGWAFPFPGVTLIGDIVTRGPVQLWAVSPGGPHSLD